MKHKTFIIPAVVGIAITFSFTADKKVTEVYNFENEVVMNIKEFSGSAVKNTSKLKFYSSQKHSNLAYVMDITTHGQSMSAEIVMDNKANTMTTLINQGGMKMAMQYDLSKGGSMAGMTGMAAETPETTPKETKTEIRKTGKTKSILGYKCEEYEITDGTSYSLGWVSEEMPMPSFYEGFTKIKGGGQNISGDMPEGFPMEMTSWPKGKASDQKVVFEVVEINKDKKRTISTEGYSVMKLN